MRHTLWKRLSKARQERGLSIDEAAHATRMRPDKIVALENDDYSRFGGNAYAKGFLLIYSRMLKVDAAEEAKTLDTPHDIRVTDYQYLANASTPVLHRLPLTSQRKSSPSIAPLVGFLVLILIAGGIFFVVTQNKRITGPAEPDPKPVVHERPTQELAPPPSEVPTTPEALVQSLPDATAALALAVKPTLGPLGIETVEPIAASPTVPSLKPASEITIGVKKKTWVKIYRNDLNSPPVFVDYVYPGPPLTRHNERLFIVAREPENLEIRKNGEPIAYVSGTAIQ